MTAEIRDCRWHIFVLECRNSKVYVAITLTSAVFATFLAVIGIGLNLYRSRARKYKIWQGGFTTIDGYLVWCNIFTLLRAIDAYGLAFGWYPRAVVSQFLSDLSYIPGHIAVVVYLCAIVGATPQTAPDIWLPEIGVLTITRRVHMAACLVIFPLSIVSGLSRDQGDIDREWAWTAAIYFYYGFLCLSYAGGFWFFGRQMVRVAERTMKDSPIAVEQRATKNTEDRLVNSSPSKHVSSHVSSKTTSNKQMGRAIFTMKMFNFQFTSIFVWFGLVLMVFAVAQTLIFRTQWWSIIQCFGTNLGTFILLMGGHMSMLYTEIRRYISNRKEEVETIKRKTEQAPYVLPAIPPIAENVLDEST